MSAFYKITGILLLFCTFCYGFTVQNNHKGLTDTTTVYVISTEVLKSSEFPEAVFTMPSLRILKIAGMDCDYKMYDDKGNDITECWAIRVMPDKISRLQQLEELELPVNNFQSLPEVLSTLPKLRIINFTDNPGLWNVEVLGKLSSLEEAYFYGCSITKFPADLSGLKKLKKLGIVGNRMSKEEVTRIRKSLPACEIIAD